MSTKPTLVFVPGAWHRAETWSKLTSLLEQQNHFKTISVTLPSTTSNPAATLKDDIDAAQEVLRAETAQGHDVVVVMHSYGGIIGQSSIKGLTCSKDQDQTTPSTTASKSGHVVGLVLISTGFVGPAKSFLEGMGGKPPPTWSFNYETGFAEIPSNSVEAFYHDLPEEEQKEWVGKLTPHSLKTLTEGGEDTYEGWRDAPIWFIATKQDKSLPIEAQRYFVQAAKDAGADVTLREVDSSHSPMLSRPQETADIIVEAVQAFKS
ncbi:hypothetical protein H2200_006729 [Cladophialophora chaetospira]|uniref:AB hydrolase-1 domain-containing protein n=1 Tax=Cladophialophora chaetospira TaxID=386627 RepID=A0AA38X8R9_9EURO|nr:hypothetical protein H2200_006729 [Cladophialophora chaetospira]